jgi:mannose-6-phosphate isomerase-like protein (cupin superfamily)
MKYQAINFDNKLSLFSDQWKPKIIGELNDYQVKLVKIKGYFVWHNHIETDEVFIVINGSMDIELRDGKVTLNSGEMFVVPKGIEHRPFAKEECCMLLIEPAGIINTGKLDNEMTAPSDVWI